MFMFVTQQTVGIKTWQSQFSYKLTGIIKGSADKICVSEETFSPLENIVLHLDVTAELKASCAAAMIFVLSVPFPSNLFEF